MCELIVLSNGTTFIGIREYSEGEKNLYGTVIQCPQCNKAWIARLTIDKTLWLPEDLEWAPYYVYVLEMPKIGHFYIGLSSEIKTRLDDHWKGRGNEWTKGKGPLELVELIPCNWDSASNIEREKTLEYIEQYGSDKVRGSRFSFKKRR